MLFDNLLFVLKPFDGATQPNHINFDYASLWVQMHHLQLACMTCETGVHIESSPGKVLEVDTTEDNISWGNYFRVKIEMDLRKVIARGRTVTLDEQKMRAPFTYEKLPKIHFKCGCIIHREQGCVESGIKQDHSGERESQFGPWLRANVSYRGNYMGSTKGRENNNIRVGGGE